MNLLASFIQMLSLKEKIPDPVHFSYIEPMINSMPREVSEKAFQNGDYRLLTSYVGLENLTNKVLTDVRIKLKSPLEFDPIVESNEGKNFDCYEFDNEANEIVLKRIDPKESVYLNLFPTLSKLSKDFEPDVIINGQLLTRGMKRMGFYSKNPSLFFMGLFTIALVLLMPFFIFYSNEVFSYLRSADPDYELVQKAHERVKGEYCTYQPIEVGPYLDWYLERSPMSMEYTYHINGVSSYEELIKQEKAVLCLTNTVNKRVK